MSAATGFPFSALVGQEELRTALLANAVSPAVGGVLVRGEKGTAKSTAVRALARLMPEVEVVAGCPYSCDPAAPDPACPAGPHPPDARAERRPARLVELPVGASTDRVAGSLDLERALTEGVSAFEPGLLAAAHRGVLYVDEVNLLADHLVDLLLDAAALGVNYVEREGVSVRHASRFLLVGTMNPEEGELRPQLLDRFGLSVDVRGSRVPSERAEVVRRQLEFERAPAALVERFADDDAAEAARIRRGRELVARVRCPEALLIRIATACASLEVDGLRADIVTAKAAVALAALDGRSEVGEQDVRRAALLALAHRRRRGPLERPGIDEEELARALGGKAQAEADVPPGGSEAPADSPPRAEPGPHDEGPEPPDDDGPPDGTDPDSGGNGHRPARRPDAPGERPSSTTPTRTETPAGAFAAPLIALAGRGRGAAGRRSPARAESGRPVGDRPHQRGAGIAALSTLRSAAPHQAARGRSGPGLVLVSGDLRSPVRESREGNLVLFVVDASGSMAARRRMAAVKGAVLSLLVDAYQRRDLIGLVTFRGQAAELLLPPTASVEVAAERLSELPTGGRTPLAAGLERAREVVRVQRVRDARRRALVVLVTDGRANAGAGATPSDEPVHRSAPRAAERAALALSRDGAGLVVLDTEEGPVRLGLAARLAAAAGAPCLRLEALEGERIAATVRAGLGEGGVSANHEPPPEERDDAPKRRKPRDRPLLYVITGHGKGKSTSAFGVMLRGWARGYRVGVFQFVKSGKWKVGEHRAAAELGGIDWEKMGDGWTWTSRDLDQSADLAREGWEEVKRRIADQRYEMLLLDEFTYALTFGWIDTAEAVEVLTSRPGFQHVIVTGRDAPPELVEAADLVSEVAKVKHPFDQGIRGQQGIEW